MVITAVGTSVAAAIRMTHTVAESSAKMQASERHHDRGQDRQYQPEAQQNAEVVLGALGLLRQPPDCERSEAEVGDRAPMVITMATP